MAVSRTRSDCEEFQAVLYIECAGMLWNGSKVDENVRRVCKEDRRHRL